MAASARLLVVVKLIECQRRLLPFDAGSKLGASEQTHAMMPLLTIPQRLALGIACDRRGNLLSCWHGKQEEFFESKFGRDWHIHLRPSSRRPHIGFNLLPCCPLPLPQAAEEIVTYGELEPENQGREGNGVGPAAAAARAPMGHACSPPLPVSLSRAAALGRSIASRAHRPPPGIVVQQRSRHSSSSRSLLAAKPLVEVGQGRLLDNHPVSIQHIVDLGGAREGKLSRDRQKRSPSAHHAMSQPRVKEVSIANDRCYGATTAAASQTATLNSSQPIAASSLLLQQQQRFVLRTHLHGVGGVDGQGGHVAAAQVHGVVGLVHNQQHLQ